MSILTVNREKNALGVEGSQGGGWFSGSWSGATARHMLESGLLPKGCCKSGLYECDKTLLWHVILAATAAEGVV